MHLSRWSCSLSLLAALVGSACGTSSDAAEDAAPAAPDAAAPDATATPIPDAAPQVPTPPPPATSVDCTVASGRCPVIAIPGDPIDTSGFHGYADPSLRADPNTGTLYMAYSWPNKLATSPTRTPNVELHLAHSVDHGASWIYDDRLYTNQVVTNPGGAPYAADNRSSDEVIDLLPIDLGTSTLWVQAHMRYLVPTGGSDIYAQIDKTSYVSLSATVLPAGAAPAALAAIKTAPEARLAPGSTDASLHPTTNLSALDGDHCTNFNQPALWYQAGTLYLVLQCFENPATGDGKAAAHFVFATTPSGADATKWTWRAVGVFATPADAAHLGQVEGTAYSLLTEMQLVAGRGGQLLAVINPASPNPTGIQPVNQYGCRAIPVTSLEPPTLGMTAGAPTVVAKAIESDLFTAPNEGTGACSYDAASTTGIVLVRKLEADPTQGFFVSLLATGIAP